MGLSEKIGNILGFKIKPAEKFDIIYRYCLLVKPKELAKN